MKCPFCGNADTQVIDSRASSEDGDVIRRRRHCPKCEKRFTTYERAELFFPSLIKRGGSRTEFSRDKLRGSIMLALRKRPVPADLIDKAIGTIEEKLLTQPAREVPTKYVGELVMEELKKLDTVAYIRFASVYKSFEDLQSFSEEIAQLTQPEDESDELPPVNPAQKSRTKKTRHSS
jgi:transcriptional repressor NrdR